jgi:hypothetical protein
MPPRRRSCSAMRPSVGQRVDRPPSLGRWQLQVAQERALTVDVVLLDSDLLDDRLAV